MRTLFAWVVTTLLLLVRAEAASFAAALPAGVEADWDLSKAYREVTASSERICLNGLWRWQPARASTPPVDEWGFFKVPGPWPGITDYMQKDCQTVFAHDAWNSARLAQVTSAWYERELVIPAEWLGRTVLLSTEYLNSFAVVYLDGQRVGEIRFPSGKVDLTSACRPGEKQVLSILVSAMPLKAVMLSYSDSASARQVKGSVPRRGLCGDVFIEAISKSPGVGDVTVRTSVRKQELTVHCDLRNLDAADSYRLRAVITSGTSVVTNFISAPFRGAHVKNGGYTFTNQWQSPLLWDIHTPDHQYDVAVALADEQGQELERSVPRRFGFRELWIDGRDFFLNGTRIYLSAVPMDNAQVGAAWSTYAAARESLERLKSFGINFVYTHNYDCEPGAHLQFEQILQAADDVGMLVALSQPHFSQYEWKSPEADRTNGYALHAAFYVKVARNHPSVVFYSMSHNATGYSEDMNPDLIDGIHAPRDRWASNNATLALRAEKIVQELDPSRTVYHHASGNLGSMHPINFYPNFVPPQELSDWFGHWATNGVKPVFLCEYGAPFTWDWTMYRGWYKGEREFGSAKVPWEFCLAEWNAQFLGDRAYDISEAEKANLRWEAQQFRAGSTWHRWDYPNPVGSNRFDERYPVFATYLTDNWRAFRGWGVSAVSPWEYEHFWKLRPGVKRDRVNLQTDWHALQQPGYSPDYIAQRYERVDLAFNREDWIATPAAEALVRNNRPLLAFIAGKPEAFTSKDHVFHGGETLRKQLILINNSRAQVRCSIEWKLDLPDPVIGASEQSIPTGEQVRLPIEVHLPPETRPGSYTLHARFQFSVGEIQEDSFRIDVIGATPRVNLRQRFALFDPRGETASLLEHLDIKFERINANASLESFDVLIVGKSALTVEGLAPEISSVRTGLKVVMFEQGSEVLEKRFGFRTAEYGLRQLFARVPDHPILNGVAAAHLRDWRGAATLFPPRLAYEMRPRYGPTVRWCDIPVTRLWRCGNQGNLASALIEKPARGDFLPILDGGYALQYTPLLEYREGQGMILFCQVDVTGRSEVEPAAEKLVANLFTYVDSWQPQPKRSVLYLGEPAGRAFLADLGLKMTGTGNPSRDILVLADPAGNLDAAAQRQIADWKGRGGRLLGIGLNQEELRLLSDEISSIRQEHISSWFETPASTSLFSGIAPADLHNRDPQPFDLLRGGVQTLGDGVLASMGNGRIGLMQVKPWSFTRLEQGNIKRTLRKFSFALSRLLANLGAASATPLLERCSTPVHFGEKRWLTGLYLDTPEEWDDPYRFFRW